MPEDTTAAAGTDEIIEMTEKVIKGLVEVDSRITAPEFVPLPDEELSYRDGLIGHLNSVGVYSMTKLTKTIDTGDRAFETTTTVYALEVGGVWNVDEWGDHEEYPDHEPDEALMVVEQLEGEGWETVDYVTIHGRMTDARHRRLVDGEGHRRPLEVGGPYRSEADAEVDAGPWWTMHVDADKQAAAKARIEQRITETLDAAGVELSEYEQTIVKVLAAADSHGRVVQGVVRDWVRRAYRAGQEAGR